jgi:hypothetical protein
MENEKCKNRELSCVHVEVNAGRVEIWKGLSPGVNIGKCKCLYVLENTTW